MPYFLNTMSSNKRKRQGNVANNAVEGDEDESSMEKEEDSKESEQEGNEDCEEEGEDGTVEAEDGEESTSRSWTDSTGMTFCLIEHDVDDFRWTADIPFPSGFWCKEHTTVECEIFSPDEEGNEEQPDSQHLKVMQMIIKNHQSLCETLRQEFFKELQGKRPGNMWWSNRSLDEFLKEAFEESDPLTSSLKSASDLTQLLKFPSLEIHSELPKYGVQTVCAAVVFSAPFEQEHGLAIVTDGKEFLASGFHTNAM